MSTDEELRAEALKRINERRAFFTMLVVYIVVNAALVGYWYISGAGYFWPGWVIFGWGIGVVLAGYRALVAPGSPSDAEVQREMDKMRGSAT